VLSRIGDELDSCNLIDTLSPWERVMADTNAIVYETQSGDSTYYIALRLSPTVMRDTLFRFGSADANTPFYRTELVGCRLQDSTLVLEAYRPGETDDNEVRLVHLLPDGSYTFRGSLNCRCDVVMSRDFSQILTCEASGQDTSKCGSLVVFDLTTGEQLRFRQAEGRCVLVADRRTSDSPIFYVNRHEGNQNLWMYHPERGDSMLTDFVYPYLVEHVWFSEDSLYYYWVDDSVWFYVEGNGAAIYDRGLR